MCAEAHLVSGEGKLGFQLEFFFSLLVTHEATVKDPRQFRQIHRGTGTNRPRRHYWIRATLVPNQTAMVPTAYLPSGPLTAVRQGSLWGSSFLPPRHAQEAIRQIRWPFSIVLISDIYV